MSTLAPGSNAELRFDVESTLKDIFAGISGVPASSLNNESTFFELGIDSLTLLQASQAISERLGVKIGFRSLLDEFSTLEALTERVWTTLPASSPLREQRKEPPAAEAAVPSVISAPAAAPSQLDLIAAQLKALNEQLLQMQGKVEPPPAAPKPQTVQAPFNGTESGRGASEPVVARRNMSRLGPQQQAHINDLVQRLSAKTALSKHHSEKYRLSLADSVVPANLRLPWKEICYPIVIDRAEGATAWDIDGNRYVDAAMGFGALLLGHSPSFVRDALREHADRGMRLGFQSDLAGEVASGICELTGVERAAFCNSGTEAVMTAIRLARSVTGRTRIAFFSGAYHGTFDGILVGSSQAADGTFRSVPRVSGVPQSMADDALVLPFGEGKSLELLRQHGSELAAILVEPAPWWSPGVDPGPFLRELREICDRTGCALIFDEVVVGFRLHLGGAQALYDVRADLVTYGKAIGAGLPIGVIAGSARFLDAIDGGQWQFGDSSLPEVNTTLFAGTFFKHSLVMSVAHGMVKHLRSAGPALQQKLTGAVTAMATTLNAFFAQEQLPIKMRNFGSGFRFLFPPELSHSDLFHHHLIDRGMYICDTRQCYVSAAHTEADFEAMVEAVKGSALAMRAGGLLGETADKTPKPPASVTNPELNEPASYPTTDGQKGLWTLSQLSPEICATFNESVSMRLSGPLDLPTLRAALSDLVERHDALRTTFSEDGSIQHVSALPQLELAVVDLSADPAGEQEPAIRQALEQEVDTSFDLETGPLLRGRVLLLGAETSLLALTFHHIIVDSWSFDILLRELGTLYSERLLGVETTLPAPRSYRAYAEQRSEPESASHDGEQYWVDLYQDGVPVVRFPEDFPRPAVQTYRGARLMLQTDPGTLQRVKAIGERFGMTRYTVLFALFQVFLQRITGQSEMIIGVHLAGQSTITENRVVGYCIEMLPVRGAVQPGETLGEHLQAVKTGLAEAIQHHAFSLGLLVRKLGLRRDPSRAPMVSVIFNMDPPVAPLAAAGEDDGNIAPWWGLSTEYIANARTYARFDQVWNMYEESGSLVLDCTYNIDLFRASTIHGWLELFRDLIEAFGKEPDAILEQVFTDRPVLR